MVQTSQVAACNARHNLPERLARWLLMVRDRTDSDNLPITEEFLSVMLGVRRSAFQWRPARFKPPASSGYCVGTFLSSITMA